MRHNVTLTEEQEAKQLKIACSCGWGVTVAAPLTEDFVGTPQEFFEKRTGELLQEHYNEIKENESR